MGGPVGAAGVYHRRIVRLFIMRSMGRCSFWNLLPALLCRVHTPVYESRTAILPHGSYWFMWMAVGISEITAIGVYVQFWFRRWRSGYRLIAKSRTGCVGEFGCGAPVW